MIRFVIGYQGAVPRAMRKRMRLILKIAYLKAGRFWHRVHRPKHFTAAGARLYGYRRRVPEYEFKKFRTKGHRDPLVFTGSSRAFTAHRDVRATSKGVRVPMATDNLTRNISDRSNINMPDELTRVHRSEEREIASVFDKTIQRELDRIQFSERVDTRRA